MAAPPPDVPSLLLSAGGGAAGGFIRVAISFLEPDQVGACCALPPALFCCLPYLSWLLWARLLDQSLLVATCGLLSNRPVAPPLHCCRSATATWTARQRACGSRSRGECRAGDDGLFVAVKLKDCKPARKRAAKTPIHSSPPVPCSGLLGTALRVGGAVLVAAAAYGALTKAGVIGKKKEEEAPAGKNGKAAAKKK